MSEILGLYENIDNSIDYSDLQTNTQDDFMSIPGGMVNFKTRRMWASQGYKFVITDFNGLLKSESSYDENNNLVYAMSKEYFNPGEKVRMFKGNNTGNNSWEWVNPGKEMDVAIEDKSIKTTSFDFRAELDISIGLSVPPPPFVTFDFSFSYDEKELKTHVASKIIHYPVIEKSTTIYKDGIKSKVENLAFDYATGNPVLTKTWDIYDKIPTTSDPKGPKHDGSIYSLNIPAHWMYNNMGRKSEDALYINDMKSSAGNIVTYGVNGAGSYDLTTNNGGSWHFPSYSTTNDPNLCLVLSASATTYDKGENRTTWLDPSIISEYLCSGAVGKFNKIYRPYKNYVYKSDVTNKLEDSTLKIYEQGLFKKFTPFDYSPNASNPSEWLKTSEITKYSPSGVPLEEKDILGTYSAVLFGKSYGFSQPIMIAQNAQRNEIKFFDFEDQLAGNPSHSGNSSWSLSTAYSFPVIKTLHLINKGATMHFWVKGTNDPDKLNVTVNNNSAVLKKTAQTGEWTLFQANLQFSLPENTDASIAISTTLPNIYIDDVRVQPSDAKAVCYVYDLGTLKLLTQFDDQHFGMFYQYNAEGQLVRKMVETEKGMKTLQETQYNIKSIPKTTIQ
jgi:hypothetical protein